MVLRSAAIDRRVRAALLRAMEAKPAHAITARGVPDVAVVGRDPLRVLVAGSGLANGYGARTHEDGVTGALGRAVHARTGRGAIVHNRASPSQAIADALEPLGLAAAASFDMVIWCPSLLDAAHRPDRGQYARALRDGVRRLRRSARPGAAIVFSAMPTPTDAGLPEATARRLARRYNDALPAVLDPLGVAIAQPPSFTSLDDADAFTPAYHAELAGRMLDPVLPERADRRA